MTLPTDQDRALWRKATETPSEITDEERRTILRLVDPATQVLNALKVSGTTPDQLEEKARTQPDSLTEAECRLLTHRYHIWSPHEALANSSIDWALEDKMANLEAVSALSTPEDYALSQAVRARSDFFAEERRKASKVTMANVARNFDKPCMWVSRLIDASKGFVEPTQQWGFILLRDTSSQCSEDRWESFLEQVNEYSYGRGLSRLVGGSIINQTKQLIVREGFVHESDREDLQRYSHS
jgi:hypothetical protein